MAITPGVGDPVAFYPDAAAHFAGTPTLARVIGLYSGGTTASILTQEDPPIPYGPITAPYFWTHNATEVGFAINPAGYYILPADGTSALDAASTAAALAADSASAQAGLNQTPHELTPNVRGSWAYDLASEKWHQRFSGERLRIYLPAPVRPTSYRVLIKDLVGGTITVSVFESIRTAAPTLPSLNLLGTLTSAGNNTIQELIVPVVPSLTEARHVVDILTGAVSGGPAIADQYHLYQLYRTV